MIPSSDPVRLVHPVEFDRCPSAFIWGPSANAWTMLPDLVCCAWWKRTRNRQVATRAQTEQTGEREPESAGGLASLGNAFSLRRYPKRSLLQEKTNFDSCIELEW